jgi:hypothetical protein
VLNQLVVEGKTADPAIFFAQIGAAYVEVLAGMRRPEQLARWLSDRTYYDISQRVKRQSMQRQLTGMKLRPDISVKKSQIFLTDLGAYQAVVVLKISGKIRAVSIRAELIHKKYRITDICLI